MEPTIRELLQRNRGEVATLESQPHPTFENTVLPLEQLSHRLSRTWSPISHLNGVLNSDELRASYNACLPLLSNYWTDLAQSEPLFRAYTRHRRERVRPARCRAAPRDRTRARRLPPRRRRTAGGAQGALQGRGAGAGHARRQVRRERARRDERVDAPRHRREASSPASTPCIVEQARVRAAEKGVTGWLFALEQPTYVAVMTDADSEALRRDFYEAWSTRASEVGPSAGKFDNTAVMDRILALRHEAAQLLDFPNYAAYALATRMAPSNQAVFDFLRQLVRVARPAAKREFAELEAFAGRPLNAWDVGYYAEKLQAKLFSISQEELRPYFPLPRVLEGLFSVAEKLFGVKIAERKGVPVYHPDARFFEILDAERRGARRLLPRCLRARQETRRRVDGRLRRPQGFRRRTHRAGGVPGVQFPARGARQTRAAHARRRRDDVPRVRPRPAPHADARGLSQHRRHQRRVLGRGRAAEPVHGEFRVAPRSARRDGAPLRNRRAAARRTAGAVARLAHFPGGPRDDAAARVRVVRFPPARRIRPRAGRARRTRSSREVRDEVAVFAVPEWNRFPHNFGHIFAGGYAAGYYSYKWAEVLAADAFAAFEEQGVFDSEVAQRFLDSILSQGGSRTRRSTRSSIFAAARRT